MEKNEVLHGRCIDYSHEGDGIVKVNNFTFFVQGCLIGETIEFKIIKLKKNYGYGKLIKVINKSINRIEPECKYFRLCGGCQLQHMNNIEQKSFKEGLVRNNIEKIGGIDVAINNILSGPEWNYRNKAQFPVDAGKGLEMGFYRLHSNNIIDIDRCLIQSKLINDIFNIIKLELSKCNFKKAVRHVLIKHAARTDQVMIVIISKNPLGNEVNGFIKKIVSCFPQIKSIVNNVNNRNDNVILGENEKLLYGQEYITDILNGLKFNISSKSFYQVNISQTEILYNKVLEYASLNENDTVVDLYCGVGTISLLMALHAKSVIGVELVKDAVENAKNNAKINNINNVEFICSNAKSFAEKCADDKTIINALIVDPPRKGLDEETIDNINRMDPEKIVYVSCNPATLARDLRYFTDLGFITRKIQPVDMFPNTYHVEMVVLMSRVINL